jgi:hypothetical protein
MQNKKLSLDDIAILILVFAVLFGTFWRLFPVWLAGFPINDGGMFYTMIQDLQSNQYRLPAYTSYNNSNIPFVYPPLGFYLGAIITDGLRLHTPLPVIQWLPGILNSISIFAFYLFVKEITQNKLQSAIATFVFSFTPHLTSWFSMGGGLTRSLGAIFMLMALMYIYRVIVHSNKQSIWGAILCSGLATLSHPESSVYTILIAVYIWVAKSRSYTGFIHAIYIALGTSAIASMWLIPALRMHEFTPLISASQSGLHSFLSFFRVLNIDIVTEEPYLDVFGAMGILGVALLVSRKLLFIPGMFAITFLFLPRSAHTLGNIPLAIACSFFITEIILPSIGFFQNALSAKNKTQQYIYFLILLIPFIAGNSLYYSFMLSNKHVSEENITAMQWVKENTPMQSSFIVINGETNGFCDSTNEWFPTLSSRKSPTTLQGNEWLQGNNFNQFAKNIQTVQACHLKGIACILSEAKTFAENFDYIYIDLMPATSECNLINASSPTQIWLPDVEQLAHLQIVFQSEQVIILQKK